MQYTFNLRTKGEEKKNGSQWRITMPKNNTLINQLKKKRAKIDVEMKKKKSKVDAQIKAIVARDNKTQRKEETRIKIILGSMLWTMEKKNESPLKGSLQGLLDKWLSRDIDKKLLGKYGLYREGGQSNADEIKSDTPAQNQVNDNKEQLLQRAKELRIVSSHK